MSWFLFVYLRCFFYAALFLAGCAMLMIPVAAATSGLPDLHWAMAWKAIAAVGVLALFFSMPAKWFESETNRGGERA